MKSLIKMTLLQWLRSPARVAVFLYPSLGLIASMILALLASEEGIKNPPMMLASAGLAIYFNVVLGVGIVSREREDGVLASFFARPIYRSTYIISRWLALAFASWFGVLLHILFQTLILTSAGQAPNPLFVMQVGAESGLVCLGISATMVAFSTIAPTYGDICLYMFAWFGVLMMMSVISTFNMFTYTEGSSLFQHIDVDYLNFIQQATSAFLLPQVHLDAPPQAWLKMTLTYVSNILAALLISIFFMNRKEISYGG